MGCSGRHLALLLFICPILFSADASFSGCVRAQPLYRFWESPSYFASNPYVSNMHFARFYSYSFDNSSQGMGLGGIVFADANSTLPSAGTGPKAEFAKAASLLSSASAARFQASSAIDSAHALSLSSQDAASSLLSSGEVGLLWFPNPLSLLSSLPVFLRLPAIIAYISEYPAVYRASLSYSADAYDSANAAIAELARKADEKRAALLHSGAGMPSYSGKAKQALFSADSLLAQGAPFCASSSRASAIQAHFLSSPGLPDFSSVGFAGYLSGAVGNGENSTVSELARICILLEAAEAQMRMEYQTEDALAAASISELSERLSALQAERLDLIGDTPGIVSQDGKNSYAVSGASFSGIQGGLRQGRARLSESKSLLSSAAALKASEGADGYLAGAISRAHASWQTSQTALLSLETVSDDAHAAVEAQKRAAEAAVFSAELNAGAPPSGIHGSQALFKAGQLLEQAKAEFSSAGAAPTLGAKFASYQKAAQLASAAISALEGKASLPLMDGARQALFALESAIEAGEKDGLQLSYEKGKLAEYRQLLLSDPSPDAILAVSEAAKQDSRNVRLALLHEYPGIGADYARMAFLAAELRSKDQSALPGFDSLAQYFDAAGELDSESAAGHMKEIRLKLASLFAQAQQELPAYFSWLLSKNARVLETSSPPILGRPQDYSATISTANPGPLSYNGRLAFGARTSVPLYSSELTGGDPLSDAYPEGESTRISLEGVAAWQPFAFQFSKQHAPAQVASSLDECGLASEAEAWISRKIAFFAPRKLVSLGIEEKVPEGAMGGQAWFLGAQYALQSCFSGTQAEPALCGSIAEVPQGKNELGVSFPVARPFSISSESRSFATQGGTTLVTYEISIANISLDCGSALVELSEPYSNISGFAPAAFGAYKISQAKTIPLVGQTRLSFELSPIRKGSSVRVQIAYHMGDLRSALLEGLSQAQLQVGFHNSSENAALLEQAQSFFQQNRTSEALIALSQLQDRLRTENYQSPDRSFFEEENASADEKAESFSLAISLLAASNSTIPAGELSSLRLELCQSRDTASAHARVGDYGKALAALHKAVAKANLDLAELSWKASEKAASDYAKARKALSQSPPLLAELEAAADKISVAQRLYAEGETLDSFVASSLASGAISRVLDSSSVESEGELESAKATRLAFAQAKQDADALFQDYSAQYSVLSGQSKKSMPSPSSFSEKISAAEKSMAAAFKAGVSAHDSLLQANQSYLSLMGVSQSIEASLSSIKLSAETSLRVAQAALSEVKGKAGDGFAKEQAEIESEVERAESFISASLFSDSLLASDRAIKASNLLLSKTSTQLDARAAAIAIASALFIISAAYYFVRRGKKKEAQEKRSLPKEETG